MKNSKKEISCLLMVFVVLALMGSTSKSALWELENEIPIVVKTVKERNMSRWDAYPLTEFF
jgi:hypothetical protein